MEIGKKQIKTIQDYRHNIKLLKYYLKKQQKLNETLKYKKGKQQKRQHIQVKQIQKPKQRIYTLNTTIAILNIKLKNMGLSLGDLFRMADSTYQGQINKQQFQNCIQRSLINQMFYAIDTNLNGILSEDEYFQFLCAYGGTESKEAVKFQKKILEKFGAALKKKSIKPEEFLSHQTNPIPVYEFSEKLKKLNFNQNQTMILLKVFDPSQEGIIKHQTFIAMMQTVKQKDQKQLQNQEFQKNVQSFCKHLRDSKLNPIKLFEQADVDKKDGVSPIQLQQAFKKFMPSQTNYQIKKWVGIVNLNNDKQITRQQFVNSIRGFYSLNQLQKFSTQYQKEHPNSKKGVQKQEFSNQKIIKLLSDKIQDKKMSNKDAFNMFDINKNGTLDKQELLDGLNTLGVHIGQIGRILAVFDSDSNGQLDLQQWLRILGEDIQVQQVQIPLDQQQQQQKQSKNVVKKGLKVLAVQKKINKQQKENKNKGNKSISKQESTKNTLVKQQSKLSKNNKEKQALKQKPKQSKENQKKETKQTKNKQTKQSQKKQVKQTQKKQVKESQKQINSRQYKKQLDKQSPQKSDKLTASKIQKNPSAKVLQKASSSKNLSKSVKQSKKQTKKQQKPSKQQQKLMRQSSTKSIKQANKNNKSTKQSTKKIVKQPEIQQKQSKKDSQKKIQAVSLKSVQTKKFVQDQEEDKNNVDQNQDYEQEDFDMIEQNQDNISKQQHNNIKRTDSDIVDSSNIKSQSTLKKVKREQNSQFVDQFAKLLTLVVDPDSKAKQAVGAYRLSDYIQMSEQTKKRKQQYLQTAQSLKKNNRQFVDKSFPASIQSLTNKPSKSVIRNVQTLKWKHYNKIFKNPILFEGTVEPNDIKQGSLGNCYFLSALACLAQYTNLIQRLFQYSDIKTGYFLVWLCIDGQWQLIQLDGNIPVDSSEKSPAFSQSNNQQLWVILLQKAYAKVYGKYQNINGGQAYEAITDLSGSPGISFSHSKVKEGELWQKLLSAQKNKQIMAAGTEQKVQETKKIQGHLQNISKQGIVLGHAYSILNVCQYKGQKIICLRNPWGKIQWNGEWSDKSKKWTSSALKQLNHTLNEDDGIFWMPFSQFYKLYGVSSINYIRPTYYHSSQKQSIKQLVIKINTKKNKSVKQGFLTISQKDHRHQGLPINTPYQRVSLILLAMKDGKVTKKISNLSSLYQSQICIEIKQLKDDQYGAVLVTMQKSTDVSVSFYGSEPVKFEYDDQVLPYLQGQAYLDEDKGQKFGDLKTWMYSTINRAFLCFKNQGKDNQKFTITVPKPQNLKLQPPYGPKNILNIPKGQIKCIKAKVIDYTKSISFGSLGLQ